MSIPRQHRLVPVEVLERFAAPHQVGVAAADQDLGSWRGLLHSELIVRPKVPLDRITKYSLGEGQVPALGERIHCFAHGSVKVQRVIAFSSPARLGSRADSSADPGASPGPDLRPDSSRDSSDVSTGLATPDSLSKDTNNIGEQRANVKE